MKHQYLAVAIVTVLLAVSAAYAEPTGDHKRNFEPVKTRQEAIARVKERLAKLEAMSDKEWADQHAKRQARFEERRAKRAAAKAELGKVSPAAAPAAATPATKQ